MEEFFNLDPINENFYEVFVKLRERPFAETEDAVKVFNEVYYQVTRMVYEHPMPTDIGKYVSDIKANLGWRYSADLVMTMSYFLISLIVKHKRPLNNLFRKRINDEIDGCLYWEPFNNLYKKLSARGQYVKYQFKPNPCEPSVLPQLYVNWGEITHDYDLSALDHVMHLWISEAEREDVAGVISDSMIISFHKRKNNEIEQSHSYLSQYTLKASRNSGGEFNVCHEPAESFEEKRLREKLLQQEKEKKALQERVDELEQDNDRLNTLLAKKKNAVGKDRKFTMGEIVAYCKGCVEWSDAKSVVAMLNKLLRRNATAEDAELVDSIEEEFMQRRYGDTHIEHQTFIPRVGIYNNHVDEQQNNYPMPQLDIEEQKRVANE